MARGVTSMWVRDGAACLLAVLLVGTAGQPTPRPLQLGRSHELSTGGSGGTAAGAKYHVMPKLQMAGSSYPSYHQLHTPPPPVKAAAYAYYVSGPQSTAAPAPPATPVLMDYSVPAFPHLGQVPGGWPAAPHI
jgi:hypothetical protein